VLLGKRPRPSPQPGTRWLPLTIQVASGVWLVLLSVVGVLLVVVGGDDTMPPTSGWDKYFFLLNVATAVAIALSLPAVLSAINIWRRTGMRRITKVKYSVVAIACLILCWFAVHWHLLGPVRV
jgi:hypothetical protein